MGENLDAINVAECICEGMIHKTARSKKLSKDELLTYNAALRMLKAVFDDISEFHYKKDEKKDGDDQPPVSAGT